MQEKFLTEMMRVLKPGGRFATFSYVHAVALPPARRFARLLPAYFRSISKSPVVWFNLPPAFVYRCRR
jgi:ubiquinone/menaquinone biosynthesis C-methylase UbiE